MPGAATKAKRTSQGVALQLGMKVRVDLGIPPSAVRQKFFGKRWYADVTKTGPGHYDIQFVSPDPDHAGALHKHLSASSVRSRAARRVKGTPSTRWAWKRVAALLPEEDV